MLLLLVCGDGADMWQLHRIIFTVCLYSLIHCSALLPAVAQRSRSRPAAPPSASSSRTALGACVFVIIMLN